TRSPKPPRRCSRESCSPARRRPLAPPSLHQLPPARPAPGGGGGAGGGARASGGGGGGASYRRFKTSGGTMDRAQHVPVLAGRVTALLAPALAAEGAVLVDPTLGRAGHARALLEACPGMFLIGIDAAVAAIEAAGELLAPYAERVTLVHARYDEIPAIVATIFPPGRDRVMGLLFDLGVSSPQLDDPARGFAYAQDAPLDMRMDRTAERTAADVVNDYPPAELARILHEYGEERFARRIAEAVVRERARAPITSTQRLSTIVKDAIPAAT